MKKLSLFLLCLMLIIGTIATVAVSAEETEQPNYADMTDEQLAAALVVSDGYSARIEDYHGVRAVFELDHALLEQLKAEGKSVTIGILIGANVTEEEYATKLVVGSEGVVNDAFCENGKIIKKYYDKDNTDTKYEFVYAVTFKDGKEVANKDVALAFRAYVTIGGNTYYIDQHSAVLGTVASLNEVAAALVETDANCYPFLQRFVKGLPEATINNVSIDKYSIYANGNVEAAKALSAAVEKATGYKLPIIDKLDGDCFVIEVDKTLDSSYKVAVEGAKITITAKKEYLAGALAIARDNNAYTVAPVEKGAYVYDTLYVGYNAETGSFDDAYLIADFATGAINYVYRLNDEIYIEPTMPAPVQDDELGRKYLYTSGNNVYIKNLFDKYMYPTVAEGEKEYTVEFVLRYPEEATDNRNTYLNLGFVTRFMQRKANGNFEYIVGGSNGYSAVTPYKNLGFTGFDTKLNSYSVTFDINNDANGLDALPYYNAIAATSNGAVITPDQFIPATTPRFVIMATKAHIYEIRVYKGVLSADEVAQNHFADVAKYFQLDVSAFCKENATVKAEVYKAFSGIAFSDTNKDDAQKLLDDTIASCYNTVSYGSGSETVIGNGDFTLPVPTENADLFRGYFTEDGVQVTDVNGKKLDSYVLAGDITVVAKYYTIYDTLYVGYNADTNSFDNVVIFVDTTKGMFDYLYAKDTAAIVIDNSSYAAFADGYLSITNYVTLKDIIPVASGDDGEYTVEFLARTPDSLIGAGASVSVVTLTHYLGVSIDILQRYSSGSHLCATIKFSGQDSTNFFKHPDARNLATYAMVIDRVDGGDGVYGEAFVDVVSAERETVITAFDTYYRFYNQDLYNLRVYDYTLSEEELAQNHFADIARYYELDLSGFLTLTAEEKINVYNAFKNVKVSLYNSDYETGKKAAQDIIADVIYNVVDYGFGSENVIGNADFTLPAPSYDESKYVFLGYFTEDGVQVTDRQGKKLSTYVLTGDITVVAKLVDIYKTLFVGYNAETGEFDNAYLIVDFATGDINYVYRLDNAITITGQGAVVESDELGRYYLLSASSTGNVLINNLFDKYMRQHKIDANGVASYVEGDGTYTVEFVLRDTVSAEKTDRRIYLNMGFQTSFLQRRNDRSDKGYRYIVGSTINGVNYSKTVSDDTEGVFWTSFNNNLNGYSITYDISADLDGASAAIPYYNGHIANITEDGNNNVTGSTFTWLTKPTYKFMIESARFYELRVYKDVLEAEQIAQNHFADVAKYFQLDVSAFCKENATVKAEVYKAFSGIAFSDTNKDDAQKLLDDAIASCYNTVSYGSGSETVLGNGDFTLPVPTENADLFLGYFTEDGVQVTDVNGKKLDSYVLADDITVVAKYVVTYTITYPLGSLTVREDATTFALNVPDSDLFLGYFLADGTQVTDAQGNKIEDFTLAGDITVEARYELTYTITYPDGSTTVIKASAETFILNVPENDLFLGYFLADGTQVTDAQGNKIEDFILTGDITVEVKLEDVYKTLFVGYNSETRTYENITLFADFTAGEVDYISVAPGAAIALGTAKFAEGYLSTASGYITLNNVIEQASGDDGKYTVELVAKFFDAFAAAARQQMVGALWTLQQRGTEAAPTAFLYKVGSTTLYTANPYDGRTLATHSMVADLTDDDDGVYASAYLNAFNGEKSMTTGVTPQTATYYRLNSLDLYAIRVYNYMLSETQLAQNHFADIAKYFQLDVSEFRAADDTTKTAVYDKFKKVDILAFGGDKEAAKEAAQTLLDNTLNSVAE